MHKMLTTKTGLRQIEQWEYNPYYLLYIWNRDKYKAEDLKQEAKSEQSSQTQTYACVHKFIVHLAMRTHLHTLLV